MDKQFIYNKLIEAKRKRDSIANEVFSGIWADVLTYQKVEPDVSHVTIVNIIRRHIKIFNETLDGFTLRNNGGDKDKIERLNAKIALAGSLLPANDVSDDNIAVTILAIYNEMYDKYGGVPSVGTLIRSVIAVHEGSVPNDKLSAMTKKIYFELNPKK